MSKAPLPEPHSQQRYWQASGSFAGVEAGAGDAPPSQFEVSGVKKPPFDFSRLLAPLNRRRR